MRRRSPLAAIAVAGLAIAVTAGLLAGGPGGTAVAARGDLRLTYSSFIQAGALADRTRAAEIGRASCRERV